MTAEDLLAARISRASHGHANRYMRLDDDFCDTCVIDRNAAIANKMVYTIFEDASDAPVWARVPCLSAVSVPQNLRHFAPPGYFADRMINDNGKLPGRVPTSIKKRAGAFAVLFVPEAFAPDKPPILAFKGTVTLRDWRNNLFASPRHYIERLLHWDPACKEGKERNEVSNLHTDLIYHVSQKGAVVVTGHSQGGGLAQVYGDWLDQHVELWLPGTIAPGAITAGRVHVVTFNPLGGEKLRQDAYAHSYGVSIESPKMTENGEDILTNYFFPQEFLAVPQLLSCCGPGHEDQDTLGQGDGNTRVAVGDVLDPFPRLSKHYMATVVEALSEDHDQAIVKLKTEYLGLMSDMRRLWDQMGEESRRAGKETYRVKQLEKQFRDMGDRAAWI